MKRGVILIALLISFTVIAQQRDRNEILIENVEIFDGIHEQIIKGNILIKGNKIDKISKNKISSLSKDVKVIDGAGNFVIPGLIDTHTHITMEGLPVGSMNTDWATMNIVATQAAKHRLLHGFTTLRNMGGNA